MKKVIIGVLMILAIVGSFSTYSLAAEEVLDNETESVLVDLKSKSEQQIAEYTAYHLAF